MRARENVPPAALPVAEPGTPFAGDTAMTPVSPMTTAQPVIVHHRPTRPDHDRPLLMIAIVASALFVVISITARIPTYRINFLFLVPTVFAIYWLRRRLHLHPLHLALLVLAILLHDVGAYGFYQNSPVPISWDIVVHYYFAIPVTLILYRALASHFPSLARWQIGVATLMFVMGLGALHEIMEFISYLLLGEEKGMLKPQTSYFFDTQRDLTNNLLGTLTALLLLAMARWVKLSKSSATQEVPDPDRYAARATE